LSVDLLPHPDMFTDARFNSSSSQDNKRDDDGAKRMFFGGERFLEGISGEANVSALSFIFITCCVKLFNLSIFTELPFSGASWLTRCFERQITVQRTEQNNPLGLEVQLHITEAVCPALSEPGNQFLSMKLDHSVQYFNFYLQKFKLNYFSVRLTGLSSIHDWGICVPKQGRRRSKSSAGLLLRAFDIALHAVI